jgi:DedD protein
MAQDNLPPQSDQELQFKKRARRRLVGAVALVLLMIIVLPMILQDRTAKAPKQDVVVSIPSLDQKLGPDQKLESESITPAPIQAVAPAAEVSPSEATAAKPAETKPVETPVTSNPPSPAVAAPAKTEPSKLESQIKAEPAKVETKAAAGGNYFVQIGVFSDPEKVKQMQEKLSEKGLKSSDELIDTAKGKKTRLRVGPFEAKKDAESAMEKIKSVGLTGIVVSVN